LFDAFRHSLADWFFILYALDAVTPPKLLTVNMANKTTVTDIETGCSHSERFVAALYI
jgi:hypothetical protein